jgi:hypothetical protein
MARRSEFAAGAGLVLASVVVALVVLEIGCRVARGREYLWRWPNFVAREWAVNDTEVNKRFIDDPLLGHVSALSAQVRSGFLPHSDGEVPAHLSDFRAELENAYAGDYRGVSSAACHGPQSAASDPSAAVRPRHLPI